MSQTVEVAQPERRGRSLRAEVLAQSIFAPWRWLRARVERLRAPIDFEPV